MTKFESEYRRSANRFLLWILWAHLPVLLGFALWQGTSVAVAIFGTLLLCAGPSALVYLRPAGVATSIAIATATMGFSGLLIYLGQGKIEYHFHVFSFLAVVTALCSPWAQLAAATTIAAHHVIGWLLVPSAVFNYEAAFSDVVLHALFVVIETAICLRIVSQLSDTVRARGILEEQVGRSAASVSAGSAEIQNLVRGMANSASEQARMVDQVADSSVTLTEEWKQREGAARESAEGMAAAVARVRDCQRDMVAMNADMEKLAEANRKVSAVLNLVMDIARQTNILAVNASIEASRSGAAGAGFGIIAAQVRELASRTGEAARDIESVLSGSISTVDQNASTVDRVAKSMDVVLQSAERMAGFSREIVQMGQSHGAAVQSISSAIQRISAETQMLAASAEESSGTTAELSRMAKGLEASLQLVQN